MQNDVSVPEHEESIDRLLSASIEVFGLTVEEPGRCEARFFLNIIAASARLVMAVDLGDHAEPAPVYRP